MTEPFNKTTPEEKIARHARAWRRVDKDWIADKGNDELKKQEFRARQQLREAIDTAGGNP